MKAKLIKVQLRTAETKKGVKFKMLDFVVQAVVDEARQEVKEFRGSMSEDYSRRYFKYAETTTKDSIGKEVDVTLTKRRWTDKEGKERTVTEVKYLNLLDENGDNIIMPKDNVKDNEINF